MPRADIAILTVIPEEYQAVLASLAFHGCQPVHDPGSASATNLYGWVTGTLNDVYERSYQIVVGMVAQPGPGRMASAVSATVSRYRPRYILLVGIAGGFPQDGFARGDVAISRVIYDYEYGQVAAEFQPRLDFTYQTDQALLTSAITLHARDKSWADRDKQSRPVGHQDGIPKLLPGAVASGGKIIDNTGNEFFAQVLKVWPKLLAVEMEGAGAASAIETAKAASANVGFMMVRGISDMPKSTEEEQQGEGNKAERDKWKQYAAITAANFTIHWIVHAWPTAPRRTRQRSESQTAEEPDDDPPAGGTQPSDEPDPPARAPVIACTETSIWLGFKEIVSRLPASADLAAAAPDLLRRILAAASGQAEPPSAQLSSHDADLDTTAPMRSGIHHAGSGTAQQIMDLVANVVKSMLDISAGPTGLTSEQSADPPLLPNPHVSRGGSFSDLERHFKHVSTIAIVGYPKSGKTTAVSEYARQQNRSCIWLTAPESAKMSQAWLDVVSFQISQSLGISTFDRNCLQGELVSFASKRAVIIVIDDAHLIRNLDTVQFLEQAAEASAGNIRLVLVGVDRPDFLAELRGSGRQTWRLPGFTEKQALLMYKQISGPLTPLQAKGLEQLVRETHGHPGMLRMAHDEVRSIQSREDFRRFLRSCREGKSPGLEAFQAGLVQRLRTSLGRDELELCRRVAVALRPFARTLAHALWTLDQSSEQFADVWERCVLCAFDNHARGQFVLPELYKQGLLSRSSADEQAKWCATAADELSKPEEGMLNVFDVRDVVIYRLLSGEGSRAMDDAARFLAHVDENDSDRIHAFLINQFESWLGDVETRFAIATDVRIRWHAMRSEVYRRLGDVDKEGQAAEALLQLLTSEDRSGHNIASCLGWAMLLLHAATTANVDLAVQAAEQVARTTPVQERGGPNSHHALVLSAFIGSGRNPLPYVKKILSERRTLDAYAGEEHRDFDLWLSVGATMYAAIENDNGGDKAKIAAVCEEIDETASAAADSDEAVIACMLRAFVSRAQIDFLRDVPAATDTALRLVKMAGQTDVRLAAFCQHTLGNAQRCSQNFAAAEEAYRRALSLCPQANRWERAETLLMLGISVARQGRYVEAERLCWNAARLYEGERLVSSAWRSAVGSFLEAAVASLRAGKWTSALRSLIRCYEFLKSEHRNTPEWIAVAQLAWRLADHQSQTESSPEIPFPGFTLGIRKPVVDSGNMDQQAPALMLGRACVVCGFPNRALLYFNEVWERTESPQLRLGVATFGLEPALVLRNYAFAVQYGMTIAEGLSGSTWSDPPALRMYALEHQIPKVVGLFVDYQPESGDAVELSTAVEMVSQHAGVTNETAEVLKAAVIGLAEAIVDGKTDSLERAFVIAISAKAKSTARWLSWYWVFRFSCSRPVQRKDLALWQWRVSWLSLEAGRGDIEFMQRFCEQEREFWARISASASWDRARDLANVLGNNDVEPGVRAGHFRDQLAAIVMEECGVRVWTPEITLQIRVIEHLQWLIPAWERVMARLADLLLSPVASEFLEFAKDHLQNLKQATASRRNDDLDVTSRWLEDLGHLQALVEMVEKREMHLRAREALLRLAPVAVEMMPASAAHYYVLLRHSIGVACDEKLIPEIQRIVSSSHAVGLIDNPSVPNRIKVGLATAVFSAKGSLAVGALVAAVSILGVQDDLQSPIRASARREANAEFERAMDELKSCIEAFDQLENQSRDSGDMTSELACVYVERAGLRKLIGATLSFRESGAAVNDEYLRPAVRDLLAAISEVQEGESRTMDMLRLRAAFEGRLIAEIVADSEAQAQFTRVINAYSSSGHYADELARLEAACSEDALRISFRRNHPRSNLGHADEATFKKFADSIMKATGYPEDRRRHVEDDVRKMARIDVVQAEFCRYLQPLQNLLHTRSPATIYARPTEYVCKCTLLGYETQIEYADIDVVIDAMQRVYCSGCDKRSPLGDGG